MEGKNRGGRNSFGRSYFGCWMKIETLEEEWVSVFNGFEGLEATKFLCVL